MWKYDPLHPLTSEMPVGRRRSGPGTRLELYCLTGLVVVVPRMNEGVEEGPACYFITRS